MIYDMIQIDRYLFEIQPQKLNSGYKQIWHINRVQITTLTHTVDNKVYTVYKHNYRSVPVCLETAETTNNYRTPLES